MGQIFNVRNLFIYEFLDFIKANTDKNLHTENRAIIANFFHLNDFEAKFKEILDKHNKQCYITAEQVNIRALLTENMLEEIEKVYGIAMRQEIYKRL